MTEKFGEQVPESENVEKSGLNKKIEEIKAEGRKVARKQGQLIEKVETPERARMSKGERESYEEELRLVSDRFDQLAKDLETLYKQLDNIEDVENEQKWSNMSKEQLIEELKEKDREYKRVDRRLDNNIIPPDIFNR